MKFKDYFKQLAAPFKIYASFECNVKESSDGGDNTSYIKNIKNTFLAVFL